MIKIFVVFCVIGTFWFFHASYLAIKISLNKKIAENIVELNKPFLVEIVKCSSQFYWYESISKIKDEEKKIKKIFEIESEIVHFNENGFLQIKRPKLTEDGFYRTVGDVMGPNVKGFINPEDTIQL